MSPRDTGPRQRIEPVLDTGPLMDAVRSQQRRHPGATPAAGDFSVDTLSFDGRHLSLGVTARRPAGYVHPAPLPDPDWAALEEQSCALLRRAGHRTGPAHVEFASTPGGPVPVRARPGHGGSRIPFLIELSRGVELSRYGDRDGDGDGDPRHDRPVGLPSPYRCAEIGFFELPTGRLRSVAGLDSISVLPYVHAVRFPFGAGAVVPPSAGCGTTADTGHGYVVVTGGSPQETARRVRHARALLRADVRPVVNTGPVAEPGVRKDVQRRT